MSQILRVISAALACAIAVSFTQTQAAPIETSPIPPAALSTLNKDFGMKEVTSMLSASATRASSKKYLEAHPDRFKFIATGNRGPLVEDAYSVLDDKSYIIGYRLTYGGENGRLAVADTIVDPRNKDAVSAAAKLVAAALDSVSTPDGYKTYFLGIQNLDSAQVLKIMVRAGAQSADGPTYDIRYVVSKR